MKATTSIDKKGIARVVVHCGGARAYVGKVRAGNAGEARKEINSLPLPPADMENRTRYAVNEAMRALLARGIFLGM